jgi:hypothetical protein
VRALCICRRWSAVAAAAVLIVLLPWFSSSARAADQIIIRLQVAQANAPTQPRIAVLSPVVAQPATQLPLLINVAPSEAIPRNSFLRLKGLPPMASLSEGHSIAPGSWAVPLNGLPQLKLSLPPSATGKSDLLISLIGEDGSLLAEARVSLVIQPAVAPPAAEKEVKAAPAPPAAEKEVKAVPPALPSRPQGPVMTPVEREAAEKLVVRGERDLQQGNVAQARQFFQRAAQAGLARGALLLAYTYDPRELARIGAVGIQPNPAEARKWYLRAQELGAPEAAERLSSLGGG